MHDEVVTGCTHAVPASGTDCPECNASRLAVEFAAQLRRGEPLTGPQKYVKGLAEDLLKQCEENAELKLLVGQLVSSDPCRLDHHGYCQEHMWVGKGECVHARARKPLGWPDTSQMPEQCRRIMSNTIQIENIWLVRVGGDVQVLVQLPGEPLPRLAITEPIDGAFSHCAHASGIESAPFAEWLADFKLPKT